MSDHPVNASRAGRPSLERVFDPKTIAMVGVSDTSRYAINTQGTLESDAEVFYVNPNYESVLGRTTYPTLTAIGKPIDAVFSVMSAQRTVELAEEAAELGSGGLVTIAGGFAELGPSGQALQDRLRNAAVRANMPVIGPNGVGYIHVPKKLDLTMLTHFDRRPGGLSIIAHSGAVLEAIAAGAWRAGGVGFNLMISAGNEPITDMADYLNYLVDDPATRVICLVIEKIRRPDAFFAAAARARAAGKPIIAVKLARTERTQRMARSHTGSITGDAWVYEQAFKQAGILRAHEVDELIDRAQFLEQLPNEKWSPVRGLFVLTATGGFAAMAGDLAAEEGVDMPEVERLSEWISEKVPGATVPNPLDATGFIGTQPELLEQLIEEFLQVPEFDTHIFLNQFAEWDVGGSMTASMFARHVQDAGSTGILAPLAGNGGWWLESIRLKHEVAVGNGLRGCLRGLNTMASFMRGREDAAVSPLAGIATTRRPEAPTIASDVGPMLGFAATMQLLAGAGIPVAKYHVLEAAAQLDSIAFEGPYVVKLADVAHRSDVGAVRIRVARNDLDAAIADLRRLANDNDLPPAIAIQEMITGSGEAFVGIRGASELGPTVAFGLGGVFVEILKRVSGRLAPFSAIDAGELIAEFDDTGVLDGARGNPAWDRDQLGQILVSAGMLAVAGRDWIDTIDINPLIWGPAGFVAVDGLCVLS